ncbi:MAG TPA: hypothetical protein VK843_01440 [Planctomycetota bacterium]|nr:hypothetical protein [Planctomycetota bacterium]
MSIWSTLLLHEVRNARSSLIAAALLMTGMLALLHVLGRGPIEIEIAGGILICLCALQLSADLFATDLASGRLSTRAALPVSARNLWSAKVGFFVVSIAALASFAILVECGWQRVFGDAASLREFLFALPSPAEAITAIALIGATGMLCSMVVENALTAALLSGLALGTLWGLCQVFADQLTIIKDQWHGVHLATFILLCAGFFLAVGNFAFVRGQRRSNSAAFRVRVALISALIVMLGFTGTVTAANWHYSTLDLSDPRTYICSATASPDGRFIAVQADVAHRVQDAPNLRSVWGIDLESGSRQQLAWPGYLCGVDYGGGWSDRNGLLVFVGDKWHGRNTTSALRLHSIRGELHQQPAEIQDNMPTPRVPDWALVSRERPKKAGSHFLRVRWKDTSFERTFEGDSSETRLGWGVLISPTPGRVILRRGQSLVLVDLAHEEQRVLIETGVRYVSPSPDATALLVRTDTQSQILSSADGRALHEPWPREEWLPAWIPGDDRSHELSLEPAWRNPPSRRHQARPRSNRKILDLDAGREIEVQARFGRCLARVADRGYVHIDEQGNLVWLDREGKLVRVIVDRASP